MSEPAPPVEAQQAAASGATAAVPTDPAGPTKNALKKKAKEEEKARKAEERKQKEEEAKHAREAANAIVRGHLLQCLYSSLTLVRMTGCCTRKLWYLSAAPVPGRYSKAPAQETLDCFRKRCRPIRDFPRQAGEQPDAGQQDVLLRTQARSCEHSRPAGTQRK